MFLHKEHIEGGTRYDSGKIEAHIYWSMVTCKVGIFHGNPLETYTGRVPADSLQ